MSKKIYEFCSNKIKRIYFSIDDFIFEKYYNLNLSGIIKPDELLSNDSTQDIEANSFQSVWNRNLRVLLEEAKKKEGSYNKFIDIGSGKGKACFYAYLKNNDMFESFIGIENSMQLIKIANENLKNIYTDKVHFIEINALNYQIPSGRNFIFLFNPFGPSVMKKFFEKNIESFIKYDSLIGYSNDVNIEILIEMGFSVIYRDDYYKISLLKIKNGIDNE